MGMSPDRRQLSFGTQPTNERVSIPEQRRRPKEVVHSAEAYLADNRSPEARERLAKHHEHKMHGTLVYVAGCGDARAEEEMAEQTLVDRRIAAAVLPEKAQQPLADPSVMFGTVSIHFAGSKTRQGERLRGCGGQDAVEELSHIDGPPAIDPLFQYAGRIAHADPTIHGLKLARRLARTSDVGKLVALTTHDHETGERRAIGYSQRKGKIMMDVTPADFHMPLDGQYDPKLIYSNGLPSLDMDSLPGNVQEFLVRYQEKLATQPVIAEDQATQDPGAIMFTTELRDSKLWLPDTYAKRNSGFRLTLYQSPNRVVSPDDQDVALAQARYVFRQSVDNAHLPGTPFHSTSTAAVLTDQYDFSRQFAARLVQSVQDLSRTDGKPSWFEFPNRKIIVGEVHNGNIHRIGEITVGVKGGVVNKFEERELRI